MNLRGKKAHLKFLKSTSSRSCPFLPGFKGYFGLGLSFLYLKNWAYHSRWLIHVWATESTGSLQAWREHLWERFSTGPQKRTISWDEWWDPPQPNNPVIFLDELLALSLLFKIDVSVICQRAHFPGDQWFLPVVQWTHWSPAASTWVLSLADLGICSFLDSEGKADWLSIFPFSAISLCWGCCYSPDQGCSLTLRGQRGVGWGSSGCWWSVTASFSPRWC